MLDGVREHATTNQGTMTTTTDADGADERAHCRRDALLLTITGPLVAAVVIAAWLATGAGYFWPIWPMLGMSIAVLVALWRAFGPLPQAAAGASEPPTAPPM
jgi:hypothetical protein